MTLKEWSIELSVSSAPAGDVTFAVTNAGTVQHKLVVIQTDLAPDALPTANGAVDESQLDVIGETPEFAAGGEESLTLHLDAGKYVLICNVPGHYQLGMHAAFEVK